MTTAINGTTGIDQVQNSIITPAKLSQPLTLDTVKNASGTAIEFTSIPSWVKRITLMTYNLSPSSTNSILIQLGDSGGYETTGYVCEASSVTTGVGATASTTGFSIISANASNTFSAHLVLTLMDLANNVWVGQMQYSFGNQNAMGISCGSKALSATLDRLRLTFANGTDTFDGGSVNIMYEG